ncbi:hypothetical protein EPA93_13285 [Ktedonosporobacter rubrisoli]|uniref:Uncharacterized protein n=1 Tax=Ktedonosporobacter rubrisoli TaxID=2509675 RepID=A0A4P6JP13_KTERU|nr:hypothetical protein [Ktedonosporobacter rubrisoli]QBD76923.1 hypothetical protein EPA93_13285 [Ktedonosporobacter rubrisoli]
MIVAIANFFFLGFLGWNILQWFTLHIAVPFTDIVTLGRLHPILFNAHYGWAVVGALIYTTGQNKIGLIYSNPLGMLWAWYKGLFLFLLMFQYDIPLAMLLNIADVLIRILVSLMITGVASLSKSN